MKKNISKLIIIGIAIISISSFSNSCYNDNGNAVVTIHLERNDLPPLGIFQKNGGIDKVLQFFTTTAEAAAWDTTHNGTLSLTINHPEKGIQTIELSADTTEYEVTLPSANNVTFTIIHQTTYNNWGGHIVTDLSAGTMDVNINMIPMAVIESIPMAYTSSRSIIISSFGAPPPSYTSGVKLYRSTSADGEYVLTTTTAFTPTGSNNAITESGIIAAGTYYYKICIYGSMGDGILSNYFSVNVF